MAHGLYECGFDSGGHVMMLLLLFLYKKRDKVYLFPSETHFRCLLLVVVHLEMKWNGYKVSVWRERGTVNFVGTILDL